MDSIRSFDLSLYASLLFAEYSAKDILSEIKLCCIVFRVNQVITIL